MSKSKPEALRKLNSRSSTNRSNASSTSPFKWRVWLGLVAIIVVSVMEWNWVWSILFIVWVIPDIRNRVTYFMEPVYRDENPVLYWAVIVTWVGLSLLSLSTLFWS